ncbi:uncharacterized protein BJ212DRAFT_471745 [Suillus subaureus]|uniref:Uncharacterized protein n=1 Tax=Suillus subaureus TaxID=48587 RepID=A0A9P7JB38_9AGAM|nr:uncharacterized protein BJ212DRAFT_471745 [Suillus subaureus]KAG1812109.1 hypothetical protein BJ212DRAFT_471745 [Suillus subaureus]
MSYVDGTFSFIHKQPHRRRVDSDVILLTCFYRPAETVRLNRPRPRGKPTLASVGLFVFDKVGKLVVVLLSLCHDHSPTIAGFSPWSSGCRRRFILAVSIA